MVATVIPDITRLLAKKHKGAREVIEEIKKRAKEK
jgi:hypothetical protein